MPWDEEAARALEYTDNISIGMPAAGFIPTSSQSTAFLARTSGLSNTDKTNYDTLITALVNNGVFAKLDCLYIYAAPDHVTATLNLVQSSFTCIENGSVSFTAYSGYLGDGSTFYLDTGFNATTAPTPKYVANNGHFSHWNLSNDTSNQIYSGALNSGTSWQVFSANDFIRVQDGGPALGSGNFPDQRGHIIGTRPSSVNRVTYRNGASFDSAVETGVGIENDNFYVLWDGGASGAKSATRVAAYSIGSDLSGGSDAANFYNALRTYMTAVGVP